MLEKSKLADGFVRDARTLRTKASAAQTPEDLLALEDIQAALLTAAGVSDKATNYLGKTTGEKFCASMSRTCLSRPATNLSKSWSIAFSNT